MLESPSFHRGTCCREFNETKKPREGIIQIYLAWLARTRRGILNKKCNVNIELGWANRPISAISAEKSPVSQAMKDYWKTVKKKEMVVGILKGVCRHVEEVAKHANDLTQIEYDFPHNVMHIIANGM